MHAGMLVGGASCGLSCACRNAGIFNLVKSIKRYFTVSHFIFLQKFSNVSLI